MFVAGCSVALVMVGCAAMPSAMHAKMAPAAMQEGPAPPVAPPNDPALAPVAIEAPDDTPAIEGNEIDFTRQVIYSGRLVMSVADVDATLAAIQKAAEADGGYMHKLAGDEIIVKAPAPRFAGLVERVTRLGVVTSRQIEAADVTEEMLDLETRLKNMETMRLRLVEMLEKADKVKDALEIEKEIQRVTEALERMKGRMRYLRTQVAFSTLHVKLNATTQQQEHFAVAMPFPWVAQLGSEMSGSGSGVRASTKLRYGVSIDLPPGFVRFYQNDYLTRAVSADEIQMRIERHDNHDRANTAFWIKLARRNLENRRGLKMSPGMDTLSLDRNNEAQLISGTRRIGDEDMLYRLAIVANTRYVYVVEVWGGAAEMLANQPAIDKAIKSMHAR